MLSHLLCNLEIIALINYYPSLLFFRYFEHCRHVFLDRGHQLPSYKVVHLRLLRFQALKLREVQIDFQIMKTAIITCYFMVGLF